jgi:hypothetical protein
MNAQTLSAQFLVLSCGFLVLFVVSKSKTHLVLASNASEHSTRMLPNFLMFFPWRISQLISAQNQ